MVEKNYSRVEVGDIKLGIRFSAPVFFEDGENMFLAEGKNLKQYHIQALSRWNIPYLLSYGHVINQNQNDDGVDADDSVYDVEEVEELEELDEVEEVESLPASK